MDKSIYNNEYHNLINKLRELRLKKQWTQARLASKIGVDQTFISKIETCERRLDVIELKIICAALNKPFVDFIASLQDKPLKSKHKK
jgi:transcriptional regulator with XRE-family HTH domain